MEIIRELRQIPNLSIALGFFDGIHKGHKAVISCAVDVAREMGCESAVVTFQEHPYCFFKGVSPKYILTLEDKYKFMEELGVDYVMISLVMLNSYLIIKISMVTFIWQLLHNHCGAM